MSVLPRENIRREEVVSVGPVGGQLDVRVVLVVVDGRTGGLGAAVHVVHVVVVHQHAVSELRLSGRLRRRPRPLLDPLEQTAQVD